MRVAGPFGCRCQSIPPCSVSTSRSSNRTGGSPASGSPTRVMVSPTEKDDERSGLGWPGCRNVTESKVVRPADQHLVQLDDLLPFGAIRRLAACLVADLVTDRLDFL